MLYFHLIKYQLKGKCRIKYLVKWTYIYLIFDLKVVKFDHMVDKVDQIENKIRENDRRVIDNLFRVIGNDLEVNRRKWECVGHDFVQWFSPRLI